MHQYHLLCHQVHQGGRKNCQGKEPDETESRFEECGEKPDGDSEVREEVTGREHCGPAAGALHECGPLSASG